VRRASQTSVGDLVSVDVEFDTAYRNGSMGRRDASLADRGEGIEHVDGRRGPR